MKARRARFLSSNICDLPGTILAAYKAFGDRFVLGETKLPSLETVRCAAMNKAGRFTKQDIRDLCPILSISSVEGALRRKLVAAGELKREGAGEEYVLLLDGVKAFASI